MSCSSIYILSDCTGKETVQAASAAIRFQSKDNPVIRRRGNIFAVVWISHPADASLGSANKILKGYDRN